jgi:hypothetical protein
MMRLSCHRFRANEVRLWLSLIVFNLGNLRRRLTLRARVDCLVATSLQQWLVVPYATTFILVSAPA